jgi:hypothetical protein
MWKAHGLFIDCVDFVFAKISFLTSIALSYPTRAAFSHSSCARPVKIVLPNWRTPPLAKYAPSFSPCRRGRTRFVLTNVIFFTTLVVPTRTKIHHGGRFLFVAPVRSCV